MPANLETWMRIASTAQSAVPILSVCAYIPQWQKLLQTRDSGSISLASWAVWCCSYSIAAFYSIILLMVTGRGWPLVITTTLGLVFVLFTMLLVWHFRDRNPVKKDHHRD